MRGGVPVSGKDTAAGATFKTWMTGPHNWHVHAKHPATGAWIAAHGLPSDVVAWVKGDQFCDRLEAEAVSR